MRSPRLVAAGAATAALALGLSTSAIGSGSADPDRSASDAVEVRMAATPKALTFKGPETVEQGQELKVINDTDPKQVGPHTVSIVKKRLLPTNRDSAEKCFSEGVCGAIAVAHEFDPMTNTIGKDNVGAGRKGWDAKFTETQSGDSWYTETKKQRTTRVVSADAGSTLWFICAVHPDMQGKIKVVE